MFGKATLHTPTGRSFDGLSDNLAMIMGRTYAWTLSDQDDHVTVKLESGRCVIIRHDALFGRLNYESV